MGGYSCLRKFKFKGKSAYGKITLPSSWAGLCPGDFDGSKIGENVVPEIFFGYYCPNGIDIGIRVGGGGGWRPFCYGNNNIVLSSTRDGQIFDTSKVTIGTQLYMKTWIEMNGSKYYAKINVSKTSYSGTDLMSQPFSVELNSTFGRTALEQGCDINREITIAANPSSYETSNAYLINGKWGATGVVTPQDVTYIWKDENSIVFTGSGATAGASGNKVLQLRKDGGTYNTNRIKVKGVTDASDGATETVSIDFRTTPSI